MFRKKEEPPMTCGGKFKLFMAAHWRGVLIFLLPPIIYGAIRPGVTSMWCAFTLVIMAIFWVAEVIPLPITGFVPILIFPLTAINTTVKVCGAYVNEGDQQSQGGVGRIVHKSLVNFVLKIESVLSRVVYFILRISKRYSLKVKQVYAPTSAHTDDEDTVMMFLGSIMLAASIEQSGYHKRLAFWFIRTIGYSHLKLLLAMCIVTSFVSMWITNTAATSMMVPILFALLKVFENEKIITIYEKSPDGSKVASEITSAYFCAVTYSATNGGISTLMGSGTNLVFKALYMAENPKEEEHLSFPKFSAFAIPYMIAIELCTYLYMGFMFFGLLRSKSKIAVNTKITPKATKAAQLTIQNETKKLGRITFWESMVIILFGGAMILFFCRSPQIFPGWADLLRTMYSIDDKKFIKDSTLAMLTVFLMLLLPSSLIICKNFTAKFHEQLPKSPVVSILHWGRLNIRMPYSFMFLLGGGIALSKGAMTSGLNAAIGESMKGLAALPNPVIILIIIILVIFITNFTSNATVCNVFAPIVMTLAVNVKVNPLWYCITAGFSASFCYMVAVGTPGNLIVKSVAKIPAGKMMKAGLGPTISSAIITFLAVYLWAPVVWPNLNP